MDVSLRPHRPLTDDYIHHLHPKSGTLPMMDLKGFFGSFVPLFVHDCDLSVADSDSESPAWCYLQATMPCSASVASCCLIADVDIYFPGDQNILMVSLIRWTDYSLCWVFR
jgi:hypothetical protein